MAYQVDLNKLPASDSSLGKQNFNQLPVFWVVWSLFCHYDRSGQLLHLTDLVAGVGTRPGHPSSTLKNRLLLALCSICFHPSPYSMAIFRSHCRWCRGWSIV